MLIKYFKWNLLGKTIPIIVAFVSIPVILKNLGTQQFGILSIFWAIIGYSSIMDLGIGKSVVKKISEINGKNMLSRASFYIWNGVFAQFLIGVLISFSLFIFKNKIIKALSNNVNSIYEIRIMLFLLFIGIPFMQIAGSFRGYVEGLEKFTLLNLVRIPLASSMYFVPVVILFFTRSLILIIFFLILTRITELLIFSFLAIKLDRKILKPSFNFKILKSMINFGLWVMISNIANSIFMVLDKLIIAYTIGIATVTYFTIPQEIINRSLIVAGVLTTSIFPFISRISQKKIKDNLINLSSELTYDLIFFYGIIVIVAFTLGYDFLKVWVGENVAIHAYKILKIMSLGLFVNSLAFIPLAIHQGLNRPNIPAIGNVVELPIYIIILFVMLKKYGIIGAALTWSLRIFFDSLYLYYMMWKKYDIPFFIYKKRNVELILLFFISLLGIINLFKVYFEGICLLLICLSLIMTAMFIYFFKRKNIIENILY